MFRRIMAKISTYGRRVVIANLRLYHNVVSPYLGVNCRYYPSCSCYATEAVQEFGVCKGLVLAIWRLLRCHPFSAGGYDPVPQNKLDKQNI